MEVTNVCKIKGSKLDKPVNRSRFMFAREKETYRQFMLRVGKIVLGDDVKQFYSNADMNSFSNQEIDCEMLMLETMLSRMMLKTIATSNEVINVADRELVPVMVSA